MTERGSGVGVKTYSGTLLLDLPICAMFSATARADRRCGTAFVPTNAPAFTNSLWPQPPVCMECIWPKSRLFVNLNLDWLPHAALQSNLRVAGFTATWIESVNRSRHLVTYWLQVSPFAQNRKRLMECLLGIWKKSWTPKEVPMTHLRHHMQGDIRLPNLPEVTPRDVPFRAFGRRRSSFTNKSQFKPPF